MQRDAENAPLLRQDERSWFTLERWKFFNVIIMGLGFMMLFTAYNTTQNFVTDLLLELGFGNLGFYSLSVLYVAVSVSVLFAPLIVAKTGERLSIWIGAACYCVYIASLITIYPVLVYAAAVVIGFGSAILWVAQGALLTKSSDESTRGRNSGIFWSIFQLSGILGNLGAFYILKDFNGSASLLFTVLLICGGVGVLILFPLRNIELNDSSAINEPTQERPPIMELLKQSIRLLARKEMLLLLVIMFYSGFELSFYSGEFPLILEDSKLIGAVMSCLGAAEVVGGLVFGKLSDLLGRKIVLTFAILCYSGSLVLSWIIKTSQGHRYLWYIAAIGLGLGDSTFNTQIYATLGSVFDVKDTVAAFTVFQLLQNIGSAAGFFYSPYLPVHGHNGTYYQLIILGVIGWLGTLLFWMIDIPSGKSRSIH